MATPATRSCWGLNSQRTRKPEKSLQWEENSAEVQFTRTSGTQPCFPETFNDVSSYRTKIRDIQAWRLDNGRDNMDAQVDGEEDEDERHNKAPTRFPRLLAVECCRISSAVP